MNRIKLPEAETARPTKLNHAHIFWQQISLAHAEGARNRLSGKLSSSENMKKKCLAWLLKEATQQSSTGREKCITHHVVSGSSKRAYSLLIRAATRYVVGNYFPHISF